MEMVFVRKVACKNPNIIEPKEGERVTVVPCPDGDESHWHVLEYPKAKNGKPQDIIRLNLRPLDEVLSEISIEELTHQLVEK